MKKVSFDFDETLSRQDVQNYAKSIKDKVEIWITTSRYEDPSRYAFVVNHDDLYTVAHSLGIPRHHIHFTNMENKYRYLASNDFMWHLDDDWHELKLLSEASRNRYTVPVGISVKGDYKSKCNKLLYYAKDMGN